MTASGSLANPIDVQTAVEAIAAGGYVAVQYDGVLIMVFSRLDRKRYVCGAGSGGIPEILSAEEIIHHMVDEAEMALRDVGSSS